MRVSAKKSIQRPFFAVNGVGQWKIIRLKKEEKIRMHKVNSCYNNFNGNTKSKNDCVQWDSKVLILYDLLLVVRIIDSTELCSMKKKKKDGVILWQISL